MHVPAHHAGSPPDPHLGGRDNRVRGAHASWEARAVELSASKTLRSCEGGVSPRCAHPSPRLHATTCSHADRRHAANYSQSNADVTDAPLTCVQLP